MRKKFLSALMLGLLALGTTSTITSCKDYDGDISSLKSDVEANKTALTQAQKDIEALKTSLTSQLETLQSKHDTDVKELKNLIAQNSTSIKSNTDAINAANSVIAGLSNSLQTLYDKVAADEAAIAAIQNQIENLAQADQDLLKLITALQNDKVDKSEFTTTTQELMTKIENLENTKLNKSVYDEAVAAIYSRLEGIETNLGQALTDIQSLKAGLNTEELARISADNNLQQQISVIQAWKELIDKNLASITDLDAALKKAQEQIDANSSSIKTNVTDIATLKSQIAALETKLNDAIKDIEANSAAIDKLTTKMNDLSTAINSLQDQVNVLNVLVTKKLTSIVFDPQSYYWGVEATEAFALSYNVYSLEPANADIKEGTKTAKYYSERFPSKAGSTALPVCAEYYMNPSTAQKSLIKDVNVLSDDKDFVVARGAAAGINVASWDVADAKLKVNLKFNDPAAIMSVPANQQITVFATQVQYGDTTITSDWASIYKTTATDLALAVIDPANGTNCTNVTCAAHQTHPHIYQTEQEAADADAQYGVAWNSTLDLSKLVETHYSNGSGYAVLDVNKYGLAYKFELVGYFIGSNNTSESAHAAINDATLRPQMPVWSDDAHKKGTAAAYGKTEQNETSIGRTPMIRVSLIDTNNDNRVVEYGYIKVSIDPTDPTTDPDKNYNEVPFELKGYTYNFECDPVKYSDALTWAQIESYIYNLYSMSRTDFDANYTKDLNSSSEFKQYVYDSKNKKFVELTNYIGVISPVDNLGADATDVAQWEISSADVKALLSSGDYKTGDQISVYFRFASKDTKKYGDIYVKLSTGALTINEPFATGLTDNNKIAENWYETNSSVAKSGYDEVHAQTLSPEDPYAKSTAVVLDYNIYNVFVGNQITITAAEGGDKTALKEFTEGNSLFTKSVIFSDKNIGKVYTGILDGETVKYTLGVSDENKSLTVTKKNGTALGTPVVIAKIVGDAVKFQHTDEGEALLNYASHNKLADDVLTAIMQVKAASECFPLPLEKDTWNVRFLRPIDVESNGASVTDAGTKAQIVNLIDLVKFNDWRNVWNPAAKKYNYYAYYNIKSIEVIGATAGENIAANVKTNLNQATKDTWVKLSSVTNNIRLTYAPSTVTSGQTEKSNYGTITYENHGNTVDDFDVQVPVVVTYEWGKIYTTVNLHVNGTIGDNSAKRN